MNEKIAGGIQIGRLKGLGDIGTGDNAIAVLAGIITATIGVMTIVGFIWFIIQLITGAIGIIGSGGDKNKYAEARQRMVYGVIGVVVLISAVFIAGLVQFIFDIDIFDLDAAFKEITSGGSNNGGNNGGARITPPIQTF